MASLPQAIFSADDDAAADRAQAAAWRVYGLPGSARQSAMRMFDAADRHVLRWSVQHLSFSR
jgi:hypothetical protein